MNQEIGVDVYSLLILCVKQIPDENLLHSPEDSGLCGHLNEREIQ